MSDHDHDIDQPSFRNEETVQRRAWIDRALAGVRERLRPHELGGSSTGSSPGAEPAEPGEPATPRGAGKPQLYLVPRSGQD